MGLAGKIAEAMDKKQNKENKMKRITTLAVLLGLVGSATASTIANWRFEEGVNGVEHAGDWDNFYQDSSGNGNHMSSWHDGVRPAGTSDRPFTTVPQTGAANNLALGFDGDEIGTFAPPGKMLNSHVFSSGWSIEASFKLNVLEIHQGIIAKEGDNTRGEAPFWMKILPWNNHVEVLFFDDNDNMRILSTDAPVVAGKWYSVAATYDNAEAKLFLKGEGDATYTLQGTPLAFTDGAALDRIESNWFIARSSWWGGPVDSINGSIDEVRISNVAIDPSKFICIIGTPVPPIGDIAMELLSGSRELALTWTTSELYSYALLKKTNLTDPTWTTNGGIAGGATSVTVTVPTTNSATAFYKVISE